MPPRRAPSAPVGGAFLCDEGKAQAKAAESVTPYFKDAKPPTTAKPRTIQDFPIALASALVGLTVLCFHRESRDDRAPRRRACRGSGRRADRVRAGAGAGKTSRW